MTPCWTTAPDADTEAPGLLARHGECRYGLCLRRLPDVRFRVLRHTAATLMLEANVNPRVVQEMLGHANSPTCTSRADERMDEMLD
jgi:integrase